MAKELAVAPHTEGGQTEERSGAPELTDANGVGCAMRPRPAKDEAVRPEDPEQVKGVSDGGAERPPGGDEGAECAKGEEDQGDGGHPCLLVGDASQDGIESQKIPLGHDVRWGGEWVGVGGSAMP